MTSVKQVAANRRNAAKSTGPKTGKGKKMTRMNALKHGLRSKCMVIPGESPEEFEALIRSLEENYKPIGMVEGFLIERIAQCLWRLRRIGFIQTAIMQREHFLMEREGDTAEDELRGTLTSLAEVFSRARSDLNSVSPYEVRTETQLRTALEELERFQAARKAVAAEAIIDITDSEQDET